MSIEDRLPPIPAEQMTPAQSEAVAELVSGPRGQLRGPFVPMLRSPEFLRRAQKLGEYLRFDNAVPTRVKELVILVIAAQFKQAYEWYVHCPLAIKAGVAPEVAQALAAGEEPAALTREERVAREFCLQLLENCQVDDAAYEAVKVEFGEQGLMDLIGMTGYYTMLAMVLNTARSPLPPGAPPAFSVPP